jgi:hypothetical protein
MSATSPRHGICPSCHDEGHVGHPCSTNACERAGLHYIPSQFTPEDHRLRDARIGMMAGDHLLVQRIHRAGIDRAYRALQIPSLMEVEVALAPSDMPKETHDNLYRQAVALGRLGAHPHVTRLVAFGRDTAGTWLVTDPQHADATLAEAIDPGGNEPLAPAAVRLLMTPLVAALGALAEAQLVHGEIRPEHVCVGPLPGYPAFVRLGGFVRIPPADGPLPPRDGETLWRAPEQIFTHSVNGTTDAYAVAAMMFALLYGHPPFPAADRAMVIDTKRDENWDPMVGHEDAPQQVLHFFRTALAAERHARFEYDDFAEALNLALDALEGGGEADMPEDTGRPPRFSDRKASVEVEVDEAPRSHRVEAGVLVDEGASTGHLPRFHRPDAGRAAAPPPRFHDEATTAKPAHADEEAPTAHPDVTQQMEVFDLEEEPSDGRPPRMHKR